MSEPTVSYKTTGSLTVCKTIDELRSALQKLRDNNTKIALVPTMGALHEGHLSLIDIAQQKADTVVVSIFVNPTQFGPNEDFDSYPRQLETDLETCAEAGVSVVFAPDQDEMYTERNYFKIGIDSLNDHMCGGSRPGFFEGIVMVVNKLFNIVQPNLAVFGQKDIQQVQIIRRMVKEFHHDIEIVSAPVQRANDGLALSSRNTYLSHEERLVAPGLFRSLKYIEDQIQAGVHKPELLIQHQASELEAKGFKIDYLGLFSMKTLKPAKTLEKGQKYIIAGAAYLGKTRLIDNILIEF